MVYNFSQLDDIACGAAAVSFLGFLLRRRVGRRGLRGVGLQLGGGSLFGGCSCSFLNCNCNHSAGSGSLANSNILPHISLVSCTMDLAPMQLVLTSRPTSFQTSSKSDLAVVQRVSKKRLTCLQTSSESDLKVSHKIFKSRPTIFKQSYKSDLRVAQEALDL